MSKKGSLIAAAAAAALATLAGGAIAAPSATATPAPTVRPAAARLSATLSLPPATVDVRTPFRLSGRTAARAKVQLQALQRGTWLSVGRPVTAGADGSYSLVTSRPLPGSVRYRTVVSLGAARGVSGTVGTTVYAWYNLGDVEDIHGHTSHYDAHLGGKTYPNSLSTYFYNPGDARWEYNVNKNCVAFSATAGPSDYNSNPASEAGVQILLDNVETSSARATLFKPTPITASIGGAIRLTVALHIVTGGRYAVGTPRIRCSADPTQS